MLCIPYINLDEIPTMRQYQIYIYMLPYLSSIQITMYGLFTWDILSSILLITTIYDHEMLNVLVL